MDLSVFVIIVAVMLFVGFIMTIIIISLIVKTVKRKARSVKSSVRSTINMAAMSAARSGVDRLAELEQQKMQQRTAVQTEKNEVRKVLREQSPNCSQCGAPNTTVEEFCNYCGTSLIKRV
ncbi:MAG: zinc ribbon domain-containing protein [Oscillospiraceae bacterium]|nr:zinc ribbon domain-containing protein [Oscillospiraceae bacterium]